MRLGAGVVFLCEDLLPLEFGAVGMLEPSGRMPCMYHPHERSLQKSLSHMRDCAVRERAYLSKHAVLYVYTGAHWQSSGTNTGMFVFCLLPREFFLSVRDGACLNSFFALSFRDLWCSNVHERSRRRLPLPPGEGRTEAE